MTVRGIFLGNDSAEIFSDSDFRAFEPVTESSVYSVPRATIDPDPTKSWLRRAWPVIRSHKGIWFLSLGMSFLALLAQVQIPRLIGYVLTDCLPATGHTTDLKPML